MPTDFAQQLGLGTAGALTSNTGRLRHCTFVDHGVDDAAVMIAGRKHFEVKGVHLTLEQFMVISRYLDGEHALHDIAEATQLSGSDVALIVNSLTELGMMEQSEKSSSLSVREFMQGIDGVSEAWGRQLSAHRLFQGLRDRSFRQEVFLGLMIETYHYVRSAPRHIATAIAYCSDRRFEELLSGYFVDEYAHADLMVRTLEKLGVPRPLIKQSRPTSGTLSLINMLAEIARKDTLGYLACTTLTEVREKDYQSAISSTREMSEEYGYSAEALDDFITHSTEDVGAGHSKLLSVALDGHASISAEQADLAIECLHDLKHSFDDYYDHVIKYYSNIANHIPRRPVNFLSI